MGFEHPVDFSKGLRVLGIVLEALGGDDGVEARVGELEVLGAGDHGHVRRRDHVVAVVLAVVEQKAVVAVDIARADVQHAFVPKRVDKHGFEEQGEVACLVVHLRFSSEC